MTRTQLTSLKTQLTTLQSGIPHTWWGAPLGNGVQFEVALTCGDHMLVVQSAEPTGDARFFCRPDNFMNELRCRVERALETLRCADRHANVRDFVKRVEAWRE